jgi:hypothetical protein
MKYIKTFEGFTNLESRKLFEEAEAPIYSDWAEYTNPDHIIVELNDGRKLQISKKHVAGGAKVYQAILQAFGDERTDVTNKIVGAMSAMLDSKIKEGNSSGENSGTMVDGKPVNIDSIELDDVKDWDRPDFADAYASYAEFEDGKKLTDKQLDELTDKHPGVINQIANEQ